MGGNGGERDFKERKEGRNVNESKEKRGTLRRWRRREGNLRDIGRERDIKERMEERMVRRGRRDK